VADRGHRNPYLVQKAKLIERIASLLDQKKLPLLADVMDESAEDVRLILEPKSGPIDPALLMESVFKLTDLEVRFALNLNVLDPTGAPRVVGLKEALQIWLDHRREVVVRRAEDPPTGAGGRPAGSPVGLHGRLSQSG
jgi:topoisomerase-4 subunit A